MGHLKTAAQNAPDEKQLSRVEAIVSSMTPTERDDHTLLNGNRRRRIAGGSGTSVEDVNRLVKQFVEMRRMLQTMGRGGATTLAQGPAGLVGTAAGRRARGGRRKKKGGPWGLIKSRN
jgi:signal recognition particle subunit SRP54